MRYLITVVIAALSLNAFGQIPNYVPSDGLVAWYPFNGNANDESGNGNDGVVNGATLSLDRFGDEESAYLFDGQNDYITLGNLDPIDNGVQQEISISLWLTLTNHNEEFYNSVIIGDEVNSNNGVILQTNVDQGLTSYGGGEPYFGCNCSIYLNTWHHILYVQNSEGVTIFLDGQEYFMMSYLNSETNEIWKVGAFIQSNNRFFSGIIDNIAIWNRALSEEEIQSIYLAEAPVSGCTDSTACNYDPEASSDDGSCIPSGCMDTDACNFNSEAECEGEACDYSCCPGPGCCSVGHYWDWELEQCFDINPTDTNLDGCTDLNDLMDILSAYGGCGAVETPWQCDEPLGYQGYDYATVSIGEQCWFAENLRTEQYSNGDPIPMIFENSEWLDTSEGARCWINNDSTYFGFPGFLYNGYVVDDSRGVCPQLWHVADDAEWIELEISHGLSEIEAHETGVRGVSIQLSQKMRVDVWGGINVLGFSAVRGGYRNWENGSFSGGIDSGAYWSNGSDLDGPGYREFHGPWDGVARDDIGISEGLSIRCIKD